MAASADTPLIISIRSLRKDRAQGADAAYSLSVPRLDVRLGEKLLITGPSGCGKSTLLDIIGMVLRPDAARSFVFYPEARLDAVGAPDPQMPAGLSRRRSPRTAGAARPRNVAAAWSKEDAERLSRWRRHVGYVLQTGGLLPFVSVRENILTARRLMGAPETEGFASLPDKLIMSLGIRHLLRKLPAQLSVGERQRVAIARALAGNPPLVLADEPTAALDPANASAVLALFSRMVDELGSTLIMVSHAPEQMRGMGFRRLRVQLETTVAEGETGTLAVLSDEAPAPETNGHPDFQPAGIPPGNGGFEENGV